jgi:hypothetical protein
MKQRLLVASYTILIFALGLRAGIWFENRKPLPPPPGYVGIEFSRPQKEAAPARRDRPINRAELISQIEALKPQLDDFHSRMSAIESDFLHELDDVLTPEQRTLTKHRSSAPHTSKAKDRPLTDDEIAYHEYEEPARNLLMDVVIPLRLDFLTVQYRLDETQREIVRSLLETRRQKVLALIDSSPTPSVKLVRLAPYVQRLAQPAAPPEAAKPSDSPASAAK